MTDNALKIIKDELERLKDIRANAYFNIITDWKFHWMFKEIGYEEKAAHIDANMRHHLKKLLIEHDTEKQLTKALSVAVKYVEHLIKDYDVSEADTCIPEIANILSVGKDGE